MTPFKQNMICLLNHSLKRLVAVVRLTIPKSAVFQRHLLIHAALMSFVEITISAKSDARPSHEGVQVAGIDHRVGGQERKILVCNGGSKVISS
jgi:hypothetical protein